MISSILVVCIGNICRSPIAEIMFKQYFLDKNMDVSVSSAGIAALVDSPASVISQELVREVDLDISQHKARQLTQELVFDSELIITMTSDQKTQVEKMFPECMGRVFRLGHWGGFDVVDPYKRPREIYKQAFVLIEEGVGDWLTKLEYF